MFIRGIVFFLISVFAFNSQAGQCLSRTVSNIFCAGDIVYPYNFTRGYGTLLGVNQNSNLVSVRDEFNHSSVYTYRFDQVAIGSGCFENACIGDFGAGGNFVRGGGEIVGVNPAREVVVIKDSVNQTSLYHMHISRVSVGYGCIDGFCVGDKVIADNFTRGDGTVLGVNHYNGSIAVRDNVNGSSLYHYFSNRLTLVQMNSAYANYERSFARFPELNGIRYDLPDIRFRHNRNK